MCNWLKNFLNGFIEKPGLDRGAVPRADGWCLCKRDWPIAHRLFVRRLDRHSSRVDRRHNSRLPYFQTTSDSLKGLPDRLIFGNLRLQPYYNQKDHYLSKRRKYLSPKLRAIKTLREPGNFATYSMYSASDNPF